jgi:hypothetical protein
MTVSDDRLGLADPGRTLTPRPRAVVAPPADAADLPRYLRATAARADADDLATAYVNCGVAISAAARWKVPAALAAAFSLRTSVARRRGDLPGAERDGETASGLMDDPRGDAAVLLLARRIAIRLDVGDPRGAEELLVTLGGSLPEGGSLLAIRYARARLFAATDRLGEGLADLFFCGERLAARQADRPGVLPWRSAAAAMLVRTGAAEAAGRLVAAEVDLARRSGPASALGRALRIEGTVHSGAAGIASLDEAVRVLEGTPYRFERAQALIAFGELLNAARRRPQARRVLREGMDLADACGSPALSSRARTLYAASGGKPRSAPS